MCLQCSRYSAIWPRLLSKAITFKYFFHIIFDMYNNINYTIHGVGNLFYMFVIAQE